MDTSQLNLGILLDVYFHCTTVAKDKYKTGKSQVPPTKHQRQAVKQRTKEHDVAEAAHLDPKYWRSTSEDEEKRA